jgi:hypothetical protein
MVFRLGQLVNPISPHDPQQTENERESEVDAEPDPESGKESVHGELLVSRKNVFVCVAVLLRCSRKSRLVVYGGSGF